MKTTFSLLFWNKLLIPRANCNGHVPFDMFHHIRPQNDTLGFLGENTWVSSIGRCATLGYTAIRVHRRIRRISFLNTLSGTCVLEEHLNVDPKYTCTKTRLFKYIENFTTKKGKFSDKKSYIFLFSAQNIDSWYSLEPPRRGGSNEYQQSMFLKNKVYLM